MRGGGEPGDRRSRYDEHLASDAWRKSPARLEELARSGRRCRLCGRGAPEARIEVHHRDYANFGRERTEDLCTLCSECHSVVTDMLRRRTHAATPLPRLRDTPRVLPGRVLVDGGSGTGGRSCTRN